MRQREAEILLKGLESQCELYRSLKDVMVRELDALASENQNSLVSLLKEKLEIMKKLEDEDQLMKDAKKEWKSLVEKDSLEFQKIQTLLKEMESLLKDILETEEKTSQMLDSFKSDFEDIKSKSNALRATKAYKPLNGKEK
ncbi:MAG: hypothetical protein JW928_06860 [Candidatus Aureabacteria bacterium]|nr:hypothetical protein [Candidatus Auribacterota bacterium]